MIGVYKITNPNGRIYIGQSTNIDVRWKKYQNLYCKDQPSLYASLAKYGPQNHIFEVIEECIEEELDNKEIYWGEYYKVLSNFHLNNRLGRGFGSFDSDETKNKKRLCHLGRNNFWLKGKKLSSDHCDKISKSKIGTKQNRVKTRKDKGQPRSCHIQSVILSKSKPVFQFDLLGNFIQEFSSGKLASKETGISQGGINKCTNNKTKTAGGFIWKYK